MTLRSPVILTSPLGWEVAAGGSAATSDTPGMPHKAIANKMKSSRRNNAVMALENIWAAKRSAKGFVAKKQRNEDVDGRQWKFHEKVPVVSAEDLWTDSEYPRTCAIACTVLQRKAHASRRYVATIDTGSPWGIESVERCTVFEVFAEQLEDDVAED